MAFAVVKFTIENDAPGVVSTKWIDFQRNVTLFPSVGYGSNIIVRKQKNPNSNWIECPVQILGNYDLYEDAKSRLVKAELTSNIHSDSTDLEDNQIYNSRGKVIRRRIQQTNPREDTS
ncbi:hypothetical protein FQR65_LT16242 [Abscondita terminalis]|nr:hypothetical protein FQR65_LT16242 [Abscondita terminalis]